MSQYSITKKENYRRGTIEEFAVIKDAELIFRNFAGEEGRYNKAGERSFGVIIDDEQFAAILEEKGWNIRQLRPRDEYDDTPRYSLSVAVSYRLVSGVSPLKVTQLTRNGPLEIGENEIAQFDYADISRCDLVLRPYEWEEGKMKAYLSEMVVRIEDSILDHLHFDD